MFIVRGFGLGDLKMFCFGGVYLGYLFTVVWRFVWGY